MIESNPYEAARGAHALVVCTRWDEFADYDYSKIYDVMTKPAFVFDGQRFLDHDKLIDIGFTQGLATPCVSYHKERAIRTYVHGDDYVSTGMSSQLNWLKQQLEKQ